MADGPAGFTQDSSCPALLRMPLCLISLRIRNSHALWSDFPDSSSHDTLCNVAVLQPPRGRNLTGLGCSPFARHYWGNHFCFLFLEVLRCFSSLGLPQHYADDRPSDGRVVPFGDPRVKGHLHLSAAFRSLSRPSSPVRA